MYFRVIMQQKLLIGIALSLVTMWSTQLYGQLLVTPHLGVNVGSYSADDVSFYEVVDSYSPWALDIGAEVAYGTSKAWAFGLGYSIFTRTHDLNLIGDPTLPDPNIQVGYVGHLITARAKYAFLERMFLHAGVSHLNHGTTEYTTLSESTTSGDVISQFGPHVGVDFIFRKWVVGVHYHKLWEYGNRTQSEEGALANQDLFQVYVGYLFRLKVTSGKIWEKKCPKF